MKTRGWRIADLALTIAAIGGVVCIVAVIAAAFFNVTLIMFKTGSMSPTIPAGSLAVVREIPSGDAAIGDIVTIDRPGALPITHRITSTTDVGNGFSSITMRGDANADDDPQPYVVGSVRIVLYSVPGLASAVIAVSNPFVMGSITIGAALLVTWAFWPRGSQSRHRREPELRGGGARSAAVIVALCAAAVPFAVPQPAQAADIESQVNGQYLTLLSIVDPNAMENMTPGRPVGWQVGISAHAPSPGLVHIGISAEGALARAGTLELSIRGCSQRWVAGLCSSGDSLWLPMQDVTLATAPTGSTGIRELETVSTDANTWLMIDVVTPVAGDPGTTATLTVHALGEGDEIEVGGTTSSRLASTGTSDGAAASIGLAAGLALGAVLLGLLLAAAARIARRPIPLGRRSVDAAQ